MTALFKDYPELKRLHDWATERGLSITVNETEVNPDGLDAKSLQVESPGKPAIQLFVFDEYGDARPDNILLCLTLVDMEFGEIDDAVDIHNWARANGLDDQRDLTHRYYQSNSVARKAFIENYGQIPSAISDHDWSLNAGAAQALRRQ
jgi:hypothetical protein